MNKCCALSSVYWQRWQIFIQLQNNVHSTTHITTTWKWNRGKRRVKMEKHASEQRISTEDGIYFIDFFLVPSVISLWKQEILQFVLPKAEEKQKKKRKMIENREKSLGIIHWSEIFILVEIIFIMPCIKRHNVYFIHLCSHIWNSRTVRNKRMLRYGLTVIIDIVHILHMVLLISLAIYTYTYYIYIVL